MEIAAYLKATGWHQEADLDGRATLWVWHDPDGAEADVALPLKREVGDFVLRMGELLRTLADVEGRSQLEILQDFLTTRADLIRVRASNTDSGTLPLEQAVAFVERSRDMMLAAACAALDKRPYYATRKPAQAMDYLGRVRMGQTERGSYVLTILSPVSPELKPAQGELLPTEPLEPYERQVTHTLVQALAALDDATREAAMHGDMAPFLEAVSRGVSANLCDAIVGLSAASPDEGIEIQVSWSRNRPLQADVPTRVRLGSDSIPIIEEASRRFRETAPLEDFEVQGFVTRLDRDPDAREGDVTITGIVDGQMRKIVVRLGPENYSEAVRAHEERRTVKCTGDLVKEGRAYRLREPRHLEVLPTEDAH